MKGRYWTAAQRKRLERELDQTKDAALFRRLFALLEIDRGCPVSEVARHLRVHRSSLHRWIERYEAEGKLDALEHQSGQGRPPKWNQELDDLLQWALAQPPVHIGYPANTWTVPLLHDLLQVHLPGQELSMTTLRRRFKERGYVWKRFRYVLPPDPEEEKKTSSSGPNQGFARPNRAFCAG